MSIITTVHSLFLSVFLLCSMCGDEKKMRGGWTESTDNRGCRLVWTADSPPAEERCQLLLPDALERGGSFSPSPFLSSWPPSIPPSHLVYFSSASSSSFLLSVLLKNPHVSKLRLHHFCLRLAGSYIPPSTLLCCWSLSFFSPSDLLSFLSAGHVSISLFP